MEYVFGTQDNIEILKTKGKEHTNLTGYHQVERKYPDQTLTDVFFVVKKIRSKEDAAGNCYDWYTIDKHYRMTDKTGPIVEKAARDMTMLENALCEQDAANDEYKSAIEDAICELDAVLNGGEES